MATRSTAASLFVSLRPDQWTKNFIVFAALIFAVKLLDPAALANASAAFLIFCALSGAVYLINDVSDREADRQHPLKRTRPVAAGEISPGLALGFAGVLAAVSVAAAFALTPSFGIAAVAYLVRRGEAFYWRAIAWFTLGFVANSVYGILQLGAAVGAGQNLDSLVLSPLTGGASSIDVFGHIAGSKIGRAHV